MKLFTRKKSLILPKDKHIYIIAALAVFLLIGSYYYQKNTGNLKSMISEITSQKDENLKNLNKLALDLENLKKEYENLKNEDQILKNKILQENIKNIETNYNKAIGIYEDILTLKDKGVKTSDLDKVFAESLKLLSELKYTEAEIKLSELVNKIKEEESKFAASITIPANIPSNNTPPGSGYSRQSVTTDSGNFMVSMVAADLNSTKVIVDTASETDCANNCPTLPLATYVSRSGAYAGSVGAYACPAEYPSCGGKTNSFDLLIMNKNKYYFNSSNNTYSNNPAVIFGNGWVRFVSKASEWGRDTSVDAVLSNFPLLILNSNITFGGNDDPKHVSRSTRGFVANKGNTVYIGIVHNASVSESAKVLKSMGVENAINLDGGGSSALWSNGYKVGPGRNLTNAILFVKK